MRGILLCRREIASGIYSIRKARGFADRVKKSHCAGWGLTQKDATQPHASRATFNTCRRPIEYLCASYSTWE